MRNPSSIAAPLPQETARGPFNVQKVRNDFPILRQRVHGKPLVYLDNAATSQKPQAVLDAVTRYYEEENANIHRGVHALSAKATKSFEEARQKIQHFINAREAREVIFVRGTTEAINLVAQTYGRMHVGAGDEVVISAVEHHSNIVPWQILTEEKKARLRVIPITDEGDLILEEYKRLLTEKTKIVAIVHVSNALGTINPVKEMIRIAHERGIPVLVDGAQAVQHLPVDVQDLDCDFYAFSGHKMYGPTGVGVLYGKANLLEAMPPYQGGGEMISSVSFEKTTYNTIPHKFEAGTPDIAGVIGLGAAVDYLRGIDREAALRHEEELLRYATEALQAVPGLKLIGTTPHRLGVVSFVMEGIHPHDIGTVLDEEGVAVRTGHHCAMPLMKRFGVPATARISLAFYNTREEIDTLVRGLKKVVEVFR